VGRTANGLTLGGGENQALVFLAIVFALNFYIIYRGLAKALSGSANGRFPP